MTEYRLKTCSWLHTILLPLTFFIAVLFFNCLLILITLAYVAGDISSAFNTESIKKLITGLQKPSAMTLPVILAFSIILLKVPPYWFRRDYIDIDEDGISSHSEKEKQNNWQLKWSDILCIHIRNDRWLNNGIIYFETADQGVFGLRFAEMWYSANQRINQEIREIAQERAIPLRTRRFFAQRLESKRRDTLKKKFPVKEIEKAPSWTFAIAALLFAVSVWLWVLIPQKVVLLHHPKTLIIGTLVILFIAIFVFLNNRAKDKLAVVFISIFSVAGIFAFIYSLSTFATYHWGAEELKTFTCNESPDHEGCYQWSTAKNNRDFFFRDCRKPEFFAKTLTTKYSRAGFYLVDLATEYE